MVILLLLTAGNSLLAALGQFAGFLQKAWPQLGHFLTASWGHLAVTLVTAWTYPHDANDFFAPLVALETERKRLEILSHLWKLRIRNIYLTIQGVGGGAGDKGLVYKHLYRPSWTHVGRQHLRLLRCCNTLWNSNINGTSIYAVYGLLNVCWEDWNVKYTNHGSTVTFSPQ